MASLRVPFQLKSFARTFQTAGYECYLVGGTVRDTLLDKKNVDYDIATDAPPEIVQTLFPRVLPTGIKHGTVTVLYRGEQIEVTTYRADAEYTDQRRPDQVTYVGTIQEDLSRRDFSMNAIAVNCADGTIVDPADGMVDIRRGIIRAIGDPTKRFREDGLRLMRACRFAAQLGFEIDPATLEGMKANTDALSGVSSERIRDELFKMLGSIHPSTGIEVMRDSNLLEQVLPELSACIDVEQKGMHIHDVYIHSLLACDAAPPDDIEVRTSALFHDIGKPGAKRIDEDGNITFHRHEELSEKLARDILRRLKTSKSFENTVCRLIRHHMFHYEPNWTDAAVRRFINRVTPEFIDPLFALRRADSAAISGRMLQPAEHRMLNELDKRVRAELRNARAFSIKDLAVNGNDLAGESGIPKGPMMGVVLDHLLETVLDDPKQNERETLLNIAKSYYRERIVRV